MDGSASCSWPIAPKVLEKPFGLRAMRTALADKDLNVRLPTGRIDCCVPERVSQSAQEERQDEKPGAIMLRRRKARQLSGSNGAIIRT